MKFKIVIRHIPKVFGPWISLDFASAYLSYANPELHEPYRMKFAWVAFK